MPIPGTKRVEYLDENVGAPDVRLTPEDLAEIDAVLPTGAASGDRYHAQAMKAIDRCTAPAKPIPGHRKPSLAEGDSCSDESQLS